MSTLEERMEASLRERADRLAADCAPWLEHYEISAIILRGLRGAVALERRRIARALSTMSDADIAAHEFLRPPRKSATKNRDGCAEQNHRSRG
jgi:hypothetical protein